jgi:hypothetical protein
MMSIPVRIKSMRRVLWVLLGGYALVGLLGLALERAGMYPCTCDADCWCKRPGLSLFRWVFPYLHRDSG